jgi:lipoic acid synthetase/lipoate-protein ligase A
MVHIILPEEKERRLVFYLAMEEYLAQHCYEDMFFLWQVPPTVIFGRSQVLKAEVNVAYCEENGIQYYRRKSGGGCVYADWGNIMISYITPQKDVETTFGYYLDSLAAVLRKIGFNAVKTEHNDVLIDDKKVSGNAFYAKPESSIVHGTLLYNLDFSEMQNAITPPKEKLSKHGVQSVRQRVVNLKDIGCQKSIDELKDYLIREYCDRERILTEDEVKAIEEIEQTYLDPDFIKGKE